MLLCKQQFSFALRRIVNLQSVCFNSHDTGNDIVKLSHMHLKSKPTSAAENNVPIVLLHGLLGNKRNFQSIAKSINKLTNQEVITVDLRNHGESPHSSIMNFFAMSKDVKCLLDDLKIEKADILGHSMGGRVAMTLALTEPDTVNKLIVEDVSPAKRKVFGATPPSFITAIHQVKMDHSLTLPQLRKYIDAQLQQTIQEKPIRDFVLTNLVNLGNGYEWKMNIDTIVARFEDIAGFPLFHSTFKGQTLFIGGGDSHYLREADLPEIELLFPRAKLIFIPGAGHWVHSEKPQPFLDAVVKFLGH